MAVKIRLKRMGKIRDPRYRIVIADSRVKRDGKTIEEIGIYHPTEQPSRIEINSERAQYWLSVGAQPTEQVLALLKLSGDWQLSRARRLRTASSPLSLRLSSSFLRRVPLFFLRLSPPRPIRLRKQPRKLLLKLKQRLPRKQLSNYVG